MCRSESNEYESVKIMNISEKFNFLVFGLAWNWGPGVYKVCRQIKASDDGPSVCSVALLSVSSRFESPVGKPVPLQF